MNDPLPIGSSPLTHIALRSGNLALCVEDADYPLDVLCGYASRRSRKRGFVFVSKVLGKHYPVRPRLMEEVHVRLATKLGTLAGPTVVIGMAETATGLAQGVYEQFLRRTSRHDVLFLHTTRYRLDRPLMLHFEEVHSHAIDHLVFEPTDASLAQLFRTATNLVLIDDELTTGRTLVNLAAAYQRLNPRLTAVHLVSITDWLGAERRAAVAAQIGVATHCHSLLRGHFRFSNCADFDPGAIPDVVGRGDCKDDYLAANFGRLGVCGRLDLDCPAIAESLRLRPDERVLVLGTGEFTHPPFRLARYLEEAGWDVHFQSTTRSPLLTGEDLTSVMETVDNYHDGIPNYLYNVGDRHYDRVVLCYETRPLPAAHRLPEQLDAATVYF
ncbi:MAG: phosphoribosyltransferase family protein [Gemmataceae bacterium]|nr:phosphoribosyltransferase family protein [Gemmataceae bacterium]